ncbi:15 kDa selenoprotein [Phytophthora cinnamomi]|uniref:15 kDa selenoprotein n=1 Tax=Phytophthora cinnamomi TaxID=4785 RepID=UPI00355ABFB8|nr:15 kDa selenoprotein [Phytophthora cinnamomi]
MRLPALLLLASCVAAWAQEAPAPSPDTASEASARLQRCATLGFDADALDCRLCGDLSTYLSSVKSTKKKSKQKAVDLVTKECGECCSDFSQVLEAEGRRFAKAVLALSQRRLKRYPKVASFLEHQAPQIKGLEVQDVESRLPMLQFLDEDGEKVEEISVAHWDEDSIAEFIGNKLLPEEVKEGGGVEEDGVVEVEEEEVVEVEVQADKP